MNIRNQILLVFLFFGSLFAENSFGYGELQWSGSWPFGRAEAVTLDLDRDLVFLGSGGAVLALDVSEPANPTLVSDSIRTMGYVTGLDYDPSNQRLYVAAGEGGMEIWDLADATLPERLSTTEVLYFGVETPVENIFYKNSFAYASCSWGYVHWLDVSDPTNPVEHGFHGGTGNPTIDLFEGDDGYAYAAGPKYQRYFIAPNGSLQGAGQSDDFTPFCNFAAGHGDVGYAGYGSTLYILDLTLPYFPIWNSINTGGVSDMVLDGALAYLVSGDELYILDVSKPWSPQVVSSLDVTGSAIRLAVDGNIAYIAAGRSGLRIVDMGVTDKRAPMEIGFYETYGVTWNAHVEGDLAYLSADEDGLVVVDISDPLSSHVIGQYVSPGDTRDAAVEGGLAYLADWDGGFRIVDVSDPTAPAEVGALESLYVWRVALSGTHAFIIEGEANQIETLRAIDVSDPANPEEVGMLPLSNSTTWEIVIQGNYAYIAHSDDGMRIVDISTPSALTQVAVFDAPHVWDVDVQGDYAYLASTDWDGGFLIVDVSNPSRPKLVSKYNPSGWFHPYKAEVSGSYAYVTRDEELYLFDVSDPANPFEVDTMTLPLGISELFCAGSMLYVAEGWAGLHIIENTQPTESLLSNKTQMLEGTGGYVNFSLSAGAEHSGRNYLLLGSLSGSVPGTPLPGGLVLPINWDVLTDLVVARINTPMFLDFLGTLNINGNAAAQLYTMGPPIGLGGYTMTFAYALYNPWDFVSNTVEIYIVP